MSYINEIFAMDEIFSLETEMEQKYGIPIFNISHWDSSDAYQKHMSRVLVLPESSLPWNYYYTYSVSDDDRQQILKNLGVRPQNLQMTMGLLLQSSTLAIVNMINLLVQYKYKKLCILQPAYFSVALCCSTLSLEYGTEQIQFTNKQSRIPIDKIIASGYDCIWITSPIFSTSYYFDKECLSDICFLKSMGLTLVFDESLALPGKELVRTFPIDEKIFAIYSPHKAISINGLKFSVIVCNKIYEDFLEQWVDVFSGALSSSNRDAAFHYISSNYLNACYPAYKSYISKTKAAIQKIVKQFPFVSMLPNTEGHYVTIFIDSLLYRDTNNIDFLKAVMENSMASFIPATLNGFDASQGFGFRINLTGDIMELEGAIGRIMQYFGSKYY